jgi:hypothetical protein
MKQAEFKGSFVLISVAVPLAALGAIYAARTQPDQDIDPVVIYFSVFGAGVGFLLGTAIGDLGRTMLAMFMGMLAAAVVAHLMLIPGMRFFFAELILLALLLKYATEFHDSPLYTVARCLGVGVVIIFCLYLALYSFSEYRLTIPGVLIGFVMMYAIIAAVLPTEETWNGRKIAAMAAMHAAAIAAVSTGFFFIGVLDVFSTRLNSATSQLKEEHALVVGGCIIVFANVITCAILFRSSYRMDGRPYARRNSCPAPETATEVTAPSSEL